MRSQSSCLAGYVIVNQALLRLLVNPTLDSNQNLTIHFLVFHKRLELFLKLLEGPAQPLNQWNFYNTILYAKVKKKFHKNQTFFNLPNF